MHQPLPRSVVVSLFMLPLLWAIMEYTKFRTYVMLESGPSGVRLEVNGQAMEESQQIGTLRSVALVANSSFFPTGCESLVLIPDGKPEIRLAVPSRFKLPNPNKPFTADWWVDSYAPETEVFRQKVDLPPGFKLKGVFTGRVLEGFEILLEGDTRLTAHFRAGNLNNDFGFILEGGKLVAQPLGSTLFLDARHFTHTFAMALFSSAFLIAAFGLGARLFRNKPGMPLPSFHWDRLVCAVLAAGALLSLWVAFSVLEARPHFQDDLGYLLRAKWLLAGKLTLDVPPHAEFFRIPFTFIVNEKWMSQYPVGWPMLLALGEAVNIPWLIAPLCSLVLGYATWRLGTECGGKAVGFAAATLGSISPFSQILSGSMMGHAAAAMWLSLFAWLYVKGWKTVEKDWKTLLFSGLALGLAFSTRPLAAFAVALPAGIYGLFEIREKKFNAGARAGFASLIFGGLAGSLPQLLDNWLVTGNPFFFAYTLCQSVTWSPAFYPDGLFWADRELALVPGMAFGWAWPFASGSPIVLGLALGIVCVPFVSGKATRADWLLLGIFLAIVLAYMGSDCLPLHGFGPRYYADVFFTLFILAARGFQVLGTFGPANGIHARMAALLFLALVLPTAVMLPKRLSQHRGYNDIDVVTEKLIRQKKLDKALVLLDGPKEGMWIRVANLLPVSLDADIVFAEKLEDNSILFQCYPDRPVFILREHELRPWQP